MSQEVTQINSRIRRWASLAILILAIALRFYALDLKPMHHDEGVNGFFLTQLVREGVYKYDPANYHGATLYYLALPFVLSLGLNEFAVRGLTALAGVLIVWLPLALRRRIGDVGALVAALLLAVSPGAVFYARYFIHESLFVLFTCGLVIFAWRFYETKRKEYALSASVCVALMFATKETAFISVGVLAIAFVSTLLFKKYVVRGESLSRASLNLTDTLTFYGGRRRVLRLTLLCGLLFLIINAAFYSSFFTYPQGIGKAFEAYMFWTRTGVSDFHAHPFATYTGWLQAEELALVLLAVFGGVTAVRKRANGLSLFVALWAFGMWLAYSLIPYKTPWLMLNFLPPMALIAGYGIDCLTCRANEKAHSRRKDSDNQSRRKIVNSNHNAGYQTINYKPALLAFALVGAAFGWGLYQSVTLNFIAYDDELYPYVYAHTKRDVLRLVDDIETRAAANRAPTMTGAKPSSSDEVYRDTVTTIAVAAKDYWSLPWYLRDYKLISYDVKSFAAVTDKLLIISTAQKAEADKVLGERYTQIGVYTLRPDIYLVLYERR